MWSHLDIYILVMDIIEVVLVTEQCHILYFRTMRKVKEEIQINTQNDEGGKQD